jgi:hypothetical protein
MWHISNSKNVRALQHRLHETNHARFRRRVCCHRNATATNQMFYHLMLCRGVVWRIRLLFISITWRQCRNGVSNHITARHRNIMAAVTCQYLVTCTWCRHGSNMTRWGHKTPSLWSMTKDWSVWHSLFGGWWGRPTLLFPKRNNNGNQQK